MPGYIRIAILEGWGGGKKVYLIKTKELIKKRGSRGRSPLAKF